MNKIKFLLVLNLFCITEQLIAENPKEVKQKKNQSQPQKSHQQQPAHPSQKPGGHNQQPQHKQPMPKIKEAHQSTSQVASMIKDFSKAVQEIPKKQQQPKSSKSSSDKSTKSQSSSSDKSGSDKSMADKKAPSKDMNKKYHEAVEKAYQDYTKLYEHIKKNHMSISQSQFDEVKKGAKKLFKCRNIQNKAWTTKAIHISGEQHNSSNQTNKK